MEHISLKQAARTARLAQIECERAAFIARISQPGKSVRAITEAERAEAKALGLALPDCPTFGKVARK